MASEQLIETWVLYSFGSLVIFARIAVRWRMVGVRGFMPDDYLIFLSWATYTVMTVAAHIVGGLGDLHALPLSMRENMSSEDAASYIYGTQWFCAGVATYILFIWTLKLNMLFLYQRVVRGLWVEKFIKPTIYLVIASFVAIYLILFCACRPYYRMWVIYPDQGPYCQPQSVLNMVPPLVLNIVTDFLIMAIPAPVVLKVQTALWKRISLFALFGAVIFIMIAAILRVTMVLLLKSGPVAAIWSCREDVVAIVVGQAILIRPMFSRSFWSNNRTTINSAHHKNTKGTDDMGSGVEMKSKQSHRNKVEDPFSLTAALVTVDEGDYHSTANATSSHEHLDHPHHGHIPQNPPEYTQYNQQKQQQQQPHTHTHTHTLSNPRQLESGVGGVGAGGWQRPSPGPGGEKLVIHVSKNVVVENMEAEKVQDHEHDRDDARRDVFRTNSSLQATTHARAWNGV